MSVVDFLGGACAGLLIGLAFALLCIGLAKHVATSWQETISLWRDSSKEWAQSESELMAKLETLAMEHGYRWIKHDFGFDPPESFGLCDKYECSTCGALACPKGDSTHLWHDGCASCSADDSKPATSGEEKK